MTVYDMWAKISGGEYCELAYDCSSCKEMYDLEYCLGDIDYEKIEMKHFIEKVTAKLKKLSDAGAGFRYEVDENDLVKILMEAATE